MIFSSFAQLMRYCDDDDDDDDNDDDDDDDNGGDIYDNKVDFQ